MVFKNYFRLCLLVAIVGVSSASLLAASDRNEDQEKWAYVNQSLAKHMSDARGAVDVVVPALRFVMAVPGSASLAAFVAITELNCLGDDTIYNTYYPALEIA